jgi:WD40 repeat protein
MANTAFMSYSHAADGKLAPRLQASLQRFAKPWHQTRAIRIFRDKTSLSVNPALWSSICKALDASEYFILLASPEAAGSAWVQKEVDYWLDRESSAKLLIVLTDGELQWSSRQGDFDWDTTDALPKNLAGVFGEEPLYLDLRWAKKADELSLSHPQFREAVSELSATLRGQSKDELIGADVRFHRRAMRLAWSAASALFILLIIAVSTAFYAYQQKEVAEEKRYEAENERDRADQQRRVAQARQLAAQSQLVDAQGTGLLERSVLLAIESNRRFPSPEATQALSQTVGLLPEQVARFYHNHNVNSASYSPDGKLLATGSDDWTVCIWDIEKKELLVKLMHIDRVMNVVFSRDGRYIAATGFNGTGQIWDISKVSSSAREEISWQPVGILEHGSVPTEIFFTGDNDYVVICNSPVSGNSAVRIFSVDKGRKVKELQHKRGVRNIDLNASGSQIASAGNDARVCIWDAKTRKRLARLSHDSIAIAVHYQANGATLFSMSDKGTVYRWNTKSWKRISRVRLTNSLDDAVFSRNGRYVATTHDNIVRVWDLESGRLLHAIKHEGPAASGALCFCPNSEYLVTAGDYGSHVRIWNLNTGKEVARFAQSSVSEITFSPDGTMIASSGRDNSARIWKYANTMAGAAFNYDSAVRRVLFSPSGNYLAVARQSGRNSLYDINKNQSFLLQHSDLAHHMAFTDDDQFLATGGKDGAARIWESATGRELVRFVPEKPGPIQKVDLSFDGRYLAVAGDKGIAYVWETAARRIVKKIEHAGDLWGVRFSPDGSYLATYGDRGRAKILKSGLWNESLILNHGDAVLDGLFSPSGRYFATASADGRAKVWETNNWDLIASFSHSEYPYLVIFNQDEKLIATADGANIRIWQIKTGKNLSRMEHDTSIHDIKFGPQGRYIVSATRDNMATVWDVTTGDPMLRFYHDDDVISIDFSVDGRFLITGSADKTAHLWYWKPEDLMKLACNRLTRNLTPKEWEEYLNGESYQKTCPDIPVNFAEWIDFANEAAGYGQKQKAIKTYRRIVDWALESNDSYVCNHICWYGSIDGYAKVVMPACNHAVDLAPADQKANYQDSRGLARALVGNKMEAISDFEAFVNSNTDNEEYADLLPKRKRWITDLRSGRNPFDSKELESLRDEGI